MSSYAPFTCAWERLTVPGLESFSLLPVTAGWSLSGTIVTLHEGIAADSRYEIYCDHSWRTQRAVIEIRFKGTTRTLGIAAGNGHWAVDNREVRELEGCVDIDLGWSPSTNLLPIRRLNLAVGGDSDTINAAWIKFPDLTIERLPQRYERLAHDLYRYSSRNGDFSADIHVDQQGIPVEYAGFWRRVPATE